MREKECVLGLGGTCLVRVILQQLSKPGRLLPEQNCGPMMIRSWSFCNNDGPPSDRSIQIEIKQWITLDDPDCLRYSRNQRSSPWIFLLRFRPFSISVFCPVAHLRSVSYLIESKKHRPPAISVPYDQTPTEHRPNPRPPLSSLLFISLTHTSSPSIRSRWLHLDVPLICTQSVPG